MPLLPDHTLGIRHLSISSQTAPNLPPMPAQPFSWSVCPTAVHSGPVGGHGNCVNCTALGKWGMVPPFTSIAHPDKVPTGNMDGLATGTPV